VNEVVYTPESLVLRPRRLLAEMVEDLMAARHLAWRLMWRDIRVQYRRSLLGASWTFIPAMATAALLTLANRARIITVSETAVPYAAYVVLGMTLWQTFLDALNGPVTALAAEKNLLAKFNVAPEAIILSKLGEALFNFAVRSVLSAALFVWYGVAVGPTLLLAPLGVAALVILGASMGLFLAPFSALYQDVPKSLPIVTSFWFFLTPIVYPAPAHGLLALIVRWNPVTPLLVTTRELVTGHPLSAATGFATTSLLALCLLLVGWLIYRVSMPIVLERARY